MCFTMTYSPMYKDMYEDIYSSPYFLLLCPAFAHPRFCTSKSFPVTFMSIFA